MLRVSNSNFSVYFCISTTSFLAISSWQWMHVSESTSAIECAYSFLLQQRYRSAVTVTSSQCAAYSFLYSFDRSSKSVWEENKLWCLYDKWHEKHYFFFADERYFCWLSQMTTNSINALSVGIPIGVIYGQHESTSILSIFTDNGQMYLVPLLWS